MPGALRTHPVRGVQTQSRSSIQPGFLSHRADQAFCLVGQKTRLESGLGLDTFHNGHLINAAKLATDLRIILETDFKKFYNSLILQFIVCTSQISMVKVFVRP